MVNGKPGTKYFGTMVESIGGGIFPFVVVATDRADAVRVAREALAVFEPRAIGVVPSAFFRRDDAHDAAHRSMDTFRMALSVVR